MSFVANTGKLAGRALFVTGASRGIGKASASTAVRDAAKVVIAAKTIELHPKIHTAAEGNKTNQVNRLFMDNLAFITHKGAVVTTSIRCYHTSMVNCKEKEAASEGQIPNLFQTIGKTLSADLVKKTQAVFQFNLKGKEEGVWHIDLKNGEGACGQGEPKSPPDATLSMDAKHFVDMFGGKLKPTTAFMMGKLKISGDLQKAMKLEKMMKSLNK